MRMLRGALGFLILITPIALFQCKKVEPVTETGPPPESSSAPPAVALTKPCFNPNLICKTDPCIVELEVDDQSNTATTAEKVVYLDKAQGIEWRGKLKNGNGTGQVSMKHVTFVEANQTQHNKTATATPKRKPDCSNAQTQNRCIGNATDFEPCVRYVYYAAVKHKPGGSVVVRQKEVDPEIEVAGTTTAIDPTDTSGTSGTSGTTGTNRTH